MIDVDFGMNLKTNEIFVVLRGESHLLDRAKFIQKYFQ